MQKHTFATKNENQANIKHDHLSNTNSMILIIPGAVRMTHTLVGIPRTSRSIMFRQTPVLDESFAPVDDKLGEEYMKVFDVAGAFELLVALANLD